MISVIVPVYNVEPYLRNCLDSIINQTYKDMEILIVDDGSIDGSDDICDEYKSDKRVRVFHIKNKGLSGARNVGLDNAKGDWIAFVDSDDWIEPEMYEVLLKRAEETGADIVECGIFMEFKARTIQYPAIQDTVCETEAIEALIRRKIRNQVWNKIWKKECFSDIRFPDGRNYEDISTVYKIVQKARVTGIKREYYHWRQRASSISHRHNKKDLEDGWHAYKKRFDDLYDCVSSEAEAMLLRQCADKIMQVWAWNWKRKCSQECINEMNEFVRKYYPVFGFQEWPLEIRIFFFLTRFDNRTSFTIAYILKYIYRAFNFINRNNLMEH